MATPVTSAFTTAKLSFCVVPETVKFPETNRSPDVVTIPVNVETPVTLRFLPTSKSPV